MAWVNHLIGQERADYFDLSHNVAKLPKETPADKLVEVLALNIFESNAIPSGEGHSAVYKKVAKINHSCRPNADSCK